MISRFLVALTCLSVLVACATTAPPRVDGRWRSEAPEPLPAGAGGDVNYLVRSFTFEGDRWRIDFTVFDDVAAQQPLLSGGNAGRFTIESAASGAVAAAFVFESRSLTARAPALAAALSAAGCGDGAWVVDVAQDVSVAGCRAFRVFPRAECDREYDRVLLDGDRLFLGARPADGNLCTPDRRPANVGDAALVRY